MTVSADTLTRTFSQKIWYKIFRMMGWCADYHEPDVDKYVVIVWPHTSNLDFFIGFIFSRAYPMPFPHFLAKRSVFKGPLGWLGRKVGGIPVDRSRRSNFVDQIVAEFDRHAHFILAITPEGTRTRTRYWKSGFYYIAQAAHVPIVMATIDYSQKQIRYGALIEPTGNIEADMQLIRRFYAGAQGRHPDRQGDIEIQPAAADAALNQT